MPDYLVTILAALIGAVIGSLGSKFVEDRLRRADQTRQNRAQLVQRYLFQLQDATESLWFRFQNIQLRGGRAVMDDRYFEISTLYALGRVLAYSRILVLDGIYPQLNAFEAELGKTLKDKLQQVDRQIRTSAFQHYHRLALAESVMEKQADKQEPHLRTSTYLEFWQRYESKDSVVESSLQPAKQRVASIQKGDAWLGVLMDLLKEMTQRLANATQLPSEIP